MKIKKNEWREYCVHDDETERDDLGWCPNCGLNAIILTWKRELGEWYRCANCGLRGLFGDGFSEPTKKQPGFEDG
jgi:DNA-directed RNA polymerase subunit RPC12/RpoP